MRSSLSLSSCSTAAASVSSTRRIGRIVLAALLGVIGAPLAANADAFKPGNLVVVRMGDGTTAISGAAAPVFLEEYTRAGAFVQRIAAPTAASGNNRAFTNAGTSTSEGFLTLSTDNRYLMMAGYNAAPGTATPNTVASATINRVVARVDMSGNFDTSTASGTTGASFSAGNARSAFSTNGTDIWIAGSNAPGIAATTVGSTTWTALSTTPTVNLRVLGVQDGQLLVSSGAGGVVSVNTVGSGTPVTAPQTVATLPGMTSGTVTSPYDYWFADSNTVYVANDTGTGTLRKWTKTAGTWSVATVFTNSPSCRGITGIVGTGGAPNFLFVTTSTATNQIMFAPDTGATTAFNAIATTVTGTAFRGIRTIPEAACCTSTGSCQLSIGGLCPNGGLAGLPGTTCTPNPCPQVACCVPSTGVCDLSVNGVCTNGGTAQAAGSSCGTNLCPRDCVVSAWSAFGACSLPCGGGTQTRTRTIITPAANGGQTCPNLSETISCNTQPCPINCVVSDWSAWGACSLPCGGGVQIRTRTIITPAANGGTPCPINLTETQSCNTQPCPVNCVLSEWSEWSTCSVPCGGGTQTRTRTVITPAAFGGTPCGSLSESQACNAQPCPVDCVVSAWSPWGACSVECGGGTQVRTRTVITPAANGGLPCGALTETQSCNTQPCPVDCVVSAWSDWGACTVTCGGGQQTRTRTVVTPAAFGGQACGALTETRACNEQPCPVDCVVSDWTPWGACSLSCGGGTQTRTRTVITPAANGGTPCPINLVETQSCNTQPCATDCVVSEWGPWSTCSANCGGGEQTRTRTIITPASSGGGACPPLTETRSCNEQPCPADCVVSDWSPWGSCSLPCGGGTQTRTRTILFPAANGGAPCPALVETQPCNTQACNVACCASNQTCTFVPATACTSGSPLAPGSTCTPNPCVPGLGTCCVIIGGCTVGTQAACPATSIWTAGGTCDPYPCTPPVRTRVARRGGVGGPPRPTDCVVSAWSDWSTCTASCGGGTQTRTRTILQPAANGGNCPALIETRPCNTDPCP